MMEIIYERELKYEGNSLVESWKEKMKEVQSPKRFVRIFDVMVLC